MYSPRRPAQTVIELDTCRRRFAATLTMAAVWGTLFAGPLALADTDAAENQTLPQRLNTTIDRALAERRIVGVVVLVMRDGHTAYHRAAGFLDREKKIPMTENAIFRLASSSKAIVSAAAMALIDRGRLGLADPVTKWLPDFTPKAPDGSSPVITVRQLLTHTSGISYPFWDTVDGPYRRANVSSGLDQPGLGMDEELRRIRTAGLVFLPGTDWRYSLSIDVLGAVISQAAGKPLPDAVRELITGPLAMTDTGFVVADPGRLAVPYYNADPEPKRMADTQDVDFGGGIHITFNPDRWASPASFPSGGAGMVGSARDYVRFLEAIRSGGASILKPSTVSSMMTNQVGNKTILSGPGWGFGFGAAIVTDPVAAQTPLPAGGWSWSGAYGSSWFVDPRRKLSVVALTNTAPEGDSGPFAMQIRQAIYGR